MNEIKIPSIEFVRLKKGITEEELNDYMEENDDGSFFVYLRYKYDFEEEWTYSIECATYDYCRFTVCWLNDWYEGQQNVEYLAISKLGEEKELGWLEEEKQKTKEETNFEHFFEDLLKTGGRYAFVNGKIKHCWNTRCCDCAFKGGNCHGEKIKWLASPYEKKTYKLTQFEYDLLQHFSVDFKFKEMGLLKEMKEKGHFKNINGDELIKDILESCEVIK